MDAAETSREHLKILLTSGMGCGTPPNPLTDLAPDPGPVVGVTIPDG